MDNLSISITLIGIGAFGLIAGAIIVELFEEVEVKTTKILNSKTGEYEKRFYESEYLPESRLGLKAIPIIGLILFITGMVWVFIRRG